MNPAAAAVAFFALGVTLFGSSLLLLFNPRSGGARWFAAFQLSIATWLGAQGWAYATGDWARMGPIVSGAVHMAPALFLGFAFGEVRKQPWAAVGAIALGLALLPADLASVNRRYAEGLLSAWNGIAWSLSTVLLVWGMSGRMKRIGASARQRRAARIILALMTAVFPIGIIGGMLTKGATHVYVMPLLMVWIQALVFIGVARLRFYDIEIRAARTGEIAASAAEQERLAVVGELAASLAHEIRNPLTGVRSLAQRLAEDEIEEAKRRRYAGVILEEVGRVERLVANLLGIARRAPRVSSGDVETPLAPLFDDLALLVGSRAEKARVRLVVDANGTAAHAAREPLAQALLNLLLNALAHAPEGTAVELRARPSAAGALIVIRDHGPGIAADELERIWEPFYSGSNGTGLGLAVVRRLAREHEWTVEAENTADGGAEFRLGVPDVAGGAGGRGVAS
ncbi:MAG TPA: HAMP domain-containing sensor histidine kinase [Longimicrobium sp.]|nr:HAMP domain-containing sensor histidine kinase [Longimicrobium sp.]